MKEKFNNIKTKKYLLLFSLLMMLNILLMITLLRTSFGQTNKENFSFQKSVGVEIMEQKDIPLRIIVVNVDNSALSHQEIVCSLQNIGNKSIRAITLLADSKSNGKVITSFFVAKLFRTEEAVIENIPIERQNIKEDETISLSIDYIEFDDGSSWGNDTTGKSKEIAGQQEGVKFAINKLKNLIKNENGNGEVIIKNLLKQEMSEINVDVPAASQSEEWKKGFKMGYRTVISILQRIEEPKLEKLVGKLNELEKNAN